MRRNDEGGEHLRAGVERVPLRPGRTSKNDQGAAAGDGARNFVFVQRHFLRL